MNGKWGFACAATAVLTLWTCVGWAQDGGGDGLLDAKDDSQREDDTAQRCAQAPFALQEMQTQTVRQDDWLTLNFYLSSEVPYECKEGTAFRVEPMPKGATLEVRSDGEAILNWTANPSRRIGRNDLAITATRAGRSVTMTVTVIVEEEWETFFMPGIQYSFLAPVGRDEFGMFHGVSAEYLIAGWIHRNENRGPSHGRVYFDIELLTSTKRSVSEALAYHLGLNLSLERNPQRPMMIPYFGVEAGGFYQKDIGHAAQLTPLAGIHLWGSQNLFVNLTGGYFFPTTKLEELRGWRAKLGINFSLW